MKKVKFEIGDRVSTIIDNQMFEGYIKGLHLELPIPIAIIEFDDGTYAKVDINNIILEPKTETNKESEKVQEETKILPDENAEVTITYGDFRDLCVSISIKIAHDPVDMFKFSAFGASLASRLFPPKNE